MTRQFYAWAFAYTKTCETICPNKYVYMNVYNIIIHYEPKEETTQILIHWRIDKIRWHIHITQYYSATRRSEGLIHARAWMRLEKTTPCKWKKPVLKDGSMWFPAQVNLPRQKIDFWLLSPWGVEYSGVIAKVYMWCFFLRWCKWSKIDCGVSITYLLWKNCKLKWNQRI